MAENKDQFVVKLSAYRIRLEHEMVHLNDQVGPLSLSLRFSTKLNP